MLASSCRKRLVPLPTPSSAPSSSSPILVRHPVLNCYKKVRGKGIELRGTEGKRSATFLNVKQDHSRLFKLKLHNVLNIGEKFFPGLHP